MAPVPEVSAPQQYDAISKQYQASKLLPFRRLAELPTLLRCLRDELPVSEGWFSLLAGLRVLDLACGEGVYARLFQRSLGAKEVVGIDVCPNMVALGRQQEEAWSKLDGHAVRFEVGDASEPIPSELGSFDLVTLIYLLGYAKTREELERMLRTVKAALRPGGVAVGTIDNPFNTPETVGEGTSVLGFVRQRLLTPGVQRDTRVPGKEIRYTVQLPEGDDFHFSNFWFPPEVIEEAARAAGLVLNWRPFVIDIALGTEFGPAMAAFLCSPGVAGEYHDHERLEREAAVLHPFHLDPHQAPLTAFVLRHAKPLSK